MTGSRKQNSRLSLGSDKPSATMMEANYLRLGMETSTRMGTPERVPLYYDATAFGTRNRQKREGKDAIFYIQVFGHRLSRKAFYCRLNACKKDRR